MFAIKPSTRVKWEEILTEDYGVEDQSAQTLVDLIVGDRRVASRRPQSQEELESTVEAVEAVVEEMDLAEFESINDQEALRNELVGQLRIDLGVVGPPEPKGTPSTEPLKALSAAPQSSEETPPEELQPVIDDFVERINDENSPLELSDFQEIARWVTAKTQENAENSHEE